MVKVANKNRKSSDTVHNKKNINNKHKSVNPFEIHINKQKYQVLGQKLKNDRGLPGISRAKAIKKRKRTILQEYNVQHKSNKFLDKRIGEKNSKMSIEDRQMARFTAERLKSHSKKSMFNLADEEVLTHRGQTLSEIEKFDDPRSDDDDEDMNGKNMSGKLDDGFVSDAHFGGGILKKRGPDGEKSHKDLIEQLITESKKRKAEKQKIREQTTELTEKLDSEWKDLLPLVSKSNKKDENTEKAQNTDSYDKVMGELRFEARGQPSDRLKSEDEIAKEEKEKLENLEKERLARMKGIEEKNVPKIKHRSADDLDDNFAYDSEPVTVTLAYDAEGKCLVNLEENEDKDKTPSDEESSEADEDNSDEDESDDESNDELSDLKQDESESSDEEVSNLPLKKAQENAQNSSNIESNLESVVKENNIEDNDLEEINEDNTYIYDNVTETTEEIIMNTRKTKNKRKMEEESSNQGNTKQKKFNDVVDFNNEPEEKLTVNKTESKVKQKSSGQEENFVEKENVEIANSELKNITDELPYTFNVPASYEELQSLFSDKSVEQQAIIIERMIKCNHPNLSSNNKQLLGTLFVYLLQHLNDLSENIVESFATLNKLMPQLFDLAQLNKENAHKSLIEILKEKQNDYRKKHKQYPGTEVLVFLKVISNLFPTSDFRHQVVTPAMIFIGQMLTNCRVKTRYDICYGLFLVTFVLEYTILSKRFMPAAINFLVGLLHMAVPKTGMRLLKIIPPFKSIYSTLVTTKNISKPLTDYLMSTKDFENVDIEEGFKIRVVNVVIKLTGEFYDNMSNIPSCIEIFEPLLGYIKKLPISIYPRELQISIENVKNKLENGILNRQINFIVKEAKKPKALRLYEPNIVKIVEGKNHKIMSKEKAERQKLLHKYKQEMKGAMREIRRDKSFIGNIKLKQKIQSDIERKDKVKKIFSEANMQQAELKSLNRKKKN